MREDIPEAPTTWRKAIPEARDQLQSRLLVGIMLPILMVPSLFFLLFLVFAQGSSPVVRLTFSISLTFGILVWILRAATPAGALCGGLICFLLTIATASGPSYVLRSELTPLMILFLLTFAATRAGRAKKAALGLAEPRRGRQASQVIANLGAGVLLLLMNIVVGLHRPGTPGVLVAYAWHGISVALVAALAEATADTVSSEIGQAFGGTPILITTLRRVPPGTDGAVTLPGTAVGVLAAAAVALTGEWSLRLSPRAALVALAGGVVGLFFDSLLGATIERKGWLGNDLVNFTSTLAAAAFALAALILL